MKQIIAILALSLIYGCKERKPDNYKPDSTGTPYELFVVAPDDLVGSAPLDSLTAILDKNMPMIEPPEPISDVRIMKPSQMTNILQKHRNLFYLIEDPKADSSSVKVAFDVYSTPQMVVYIEGANKDSLVSIITRRKEQIEKLIDKIEKQRAVARMTKYPEQKVVDSIERIFDLSIEVPRGYKVRNIIDSDMVWISYETPAVSQGMFIYSYPYDSVSGVTNESIIMMRNLYGSMIPGEREGSYMTTSMVAFDPIFETIKINGRTWIETRGLWELYNDYMGGPFVSYSTLDTKNNRVVCFDAYLYSPKPGKGYRNFLRQLESIVWSVKIP